MINDPVLLNDWHVVGPVNALDESGMMSARLLGEDIVIWRAGEQVLAWQDLCLHRGSKLSLGEVHGETLMCPYHGWTYGSQGQCVLMPAHPQQKPPTKARVKTYHACVAYDLVWVCLGEPGYDLPPFPEWDDSTFRRILCGPYTFKAAGPRMVENFLDVAHFPFVHENILGVRDRPEIAEYDVVTDETGITASDIDVFQPNPDGTGEAKTVTYTYKVFRPLVAYFKKESTGPRFAIIMMVTPIEETLSLMWMWMVMNHSYEKSEEELRAFQDEIALQDLPIVESQRPELLPLDLQAELHLRSDRTAIAYRRWLNDLGVTFGTA
ncbi:MAG: aromatic ring-hydroxylating dioxygenase subunit alpha [Anaerolineae bacterium]|nr:aromatic ring-hydroxylating dioxygenase subunit alpha [Anaerolineae bacterium]